MLEYFRRAPPARAKQSSWANDDPKDHPHQRLEAFRHDVRACPGTRGNEVLEERFVRAMPIGKLPANIQAPWADLKTVVEVIRARAGKEFSVTRSFYISSRPPTAKQLAACIRDHWKIENELHYVLDVTFGDDRRKIRSELGAQNFALVCRHALSLIKRDPRKKSVAGKKRFAMWNPHSALKLLTYGFQEL